MARLVALAGALLLTGGAAAEGDPSSWMAPFFSTMVREHLLDAAIGSSPLAQDERLDRAAAAIAEDVCGGPVVTEQGRGFTIARTRLWEANVSDVDFTFRVVPFDGDLALDPVRAAVADIDPRRQLDTLGVGGSAEGDRGCIVVLLTRRDADILLPLQPEEHGQPEVRLWLRPGLSSPRLERIEPGGEVVALQTTHLGQRAWIAQDRPGLRPGLHRLEVFACQGSREQLVAIAAVEQSGAHLPPDDPPGWEHRMLDAERARHGLPSLRWHDGLADLAQDHSARLRDGEAVFGHLSPDSPGQRITSAGIPHDLALENVARAATLPLAHTLFMASPSHRAAVLDPDVTHVGVGVARSEPLAWYVTADFVRLLPPLDLEATERRIRQAVTDLRSDIRPLQPKRQLDRIAGDWSERLAAAGVTRLDDAQVRELTDDVRFHLDDATRVVADLAVIGDPEQVTLLAELRHPPFDQYGLGIYQDGSTGMLHVLVILVDRKTQ